MEEYTETYTSNIPKDDSYISQILSILRHPFKIYESYKERKEKEKKRKEKEQKEEALESMLEECKVETASYNTFCFGYFYKYYFQNVRT